MPAEGLLQLEGDEPVLGEGPVRRMLRRVRVGQEGAFEEGARRHPRMPWGRGAAAPDSRSPTHKAGRLPGTEEVAHGVPGS